MKPETLADLQTPALVLDLDIMQANINRMAKRSKELGVPLRPHLKTPKSAHIAHLLQNAGAQGFNVSTIKEAEYFHAAGIDDLYYCVPFAPNKAERAVALVQSDCMLTLMTDSLDGARAAIAAIEAVSGKAVLGFTIEIDVDGYRSGAPLGSSEIVAAAKLFESSARTRFAGIMSYAGASYGKTPDETRELTKLHLKALAATKADLFAAGLGCDMVSIGSTPAILHADNLDGATEARAGIYTFQDLFQAGIGACTIDDIALSVLSSVISRQPQYNRFVIDAGGLALSKDRSTQGKPYDALYGLVCDVKTGKQIGDLVVSLVSQELGLVTSQSGLPVDLDAFPIGSLVRVLPNHADMTAAAYESYAVVAGSDKIKHIWGRTNRWDEEV